MRKKALLASLTGAAILLGGLAGVAVPASAASTRTVTIWSNYNGAGLDLWNSAVARVQAAHPELKVVSVGSIDMAKSLAAINAGTGPDLSVSSGSGNLGWFCGSGAWQDISKLARNSATGLNLTTTFTAASLAATTSNHIRCGLPLSTEVFAFYFNKDILAKYGYAAPPKTTDELTAMSKKMTTFDANGDIKSAGFVPWAGYYGFAMDSMWLGQMFGAKWYSVDGKGTSGFGVDPAWTAAFNWQRHFIATVFGGGDFAKGSRLVTKFVAGRGDEWGTSHDFMTGRVAMKWDANWMSQMFCTGDNWVIASTCTSGLNFGIAPFPVAPKLVSTLYGAGVVGEPSIGISKGSKNVKDAWTVMKALATDTTFASAYDSYGASPSVLLSSLAKPKTQPAWYEPIYSIVKNPKSGYHTMQNTGEHQEEGLLQDLMASWQAGQTPNISSALSDLGTQVNQIIAYNK
ncbi:MAG: hypothetical protein WCP71_02365 [Actinomycetes bacterium]